MPAIHWIETTRFHSDMQKLEIKLILLGKFYYRKEITNKHLRIHQPHFQLLSSLPNRTNTERNIKNFNLHGR